MKKLQPRKIGSRILPAAVLAGLALSGGARGGTFTSDFASPPAGATIYGDGTSSGVIDAGILKLTLNVGSMQGGIVVDDLDAGKAVTGLTATFKLLIGGGSGADGFSFSFGPDVPDAATGEEGAGTGLTVSFDTYDNGGGEAPAIDIKKGGVVIASAKGTGGIFRNNQFNAVRINVDNDGSLDLSVGSNVIFTNLLGAFAASPGRFNIGARTGGSADNHWIDDLSLTTRTDAPTAPIALSANPQGTEVSPGATINIQLKDVGTQVNTSSVKLKYDGSDVVATVNKAGDVTTITYDPPGLIPPATTHQVSVTFADNAATPKTQEIAYSFTVPAYKSLGPAAKVTPDTAKPGFLFRVFANTANQTTSNARAEDAVAGRLKAADGTALPNLADPAQQGVALATAAAPSPDNGTVNFEIATVINMSQNGSDNAGNWTTDDVMPGIPATDGSTDGIAAEIISYIELPAGAVTMGVNSDDGFRTTGGLIGDAFGKVVLGEFDGGRGAADTLFTFVVEEAGVYPFRTIWEEGGGGANVEWFSVKADGTKVLINDTANGGLKAYRAIKSSSPVAIKSVSPEPAPRQMAGVSSALTITLADGSIDKVVDASATLKVDGKDVPVTPTRNGSTVTLTFSPTGLLIPSESHTAELSFKDSAGNTRTQSWPFRNLKRIVVPAAAVTENFDSLPDGKVPAGWNAWNFTVTCGDGGEDPTTQTSDTYKNWVVTTLDNVRNVDGDRVFNVAPDQKINDTLIDTPEKLFSGNVLYAESDSRCNGPTLDTEAGWNGQTQFIVSKAFDLSNLKKGVVMTLSSIYEQNQDSYGGIEYSVDGGKTFLPIAYFLDGPDIVANPDGTVDAVKTFTNANTDTSAWVDNGVAKGGKYGDGVGAPISQALADYIVPRVNDDRVEGKRVEIFRLPAATGKSDVRLRLSAMGTDSWYFAVDNIAFYDVEGPASTGSGQPAELGQTVNGFQDDFTGATRDPNWVPRGPGGDLYKQADGLLRVTVRSGDPNHLLYEAPGYSTNVQEVLARIRITAFGAVDGSRGGVGVGVGTNSQGINLHFRNATDGSLTGRHFNALDDARAWGPGTKLEWSTNVWYWLRLKQEKDAAGGTNDVWGKVWVADGKTAEPDSWQIAWNYIPTRTERAGFAGITGSSIDGLGNFEVDYVLIKAAGLPSIKVNFAEQGPGATAPAITGISKVSATQVQVDWVGVAELQSTTDLVAGPWTAVAGAATPYKVTASGTQKFFRLKY